MLNECLLWEERQSGKQRKGGGGGEAAEAQAEEGGKRGGAGADGSRAEAEGEGGGEEGGKVKWKLPSASLSIIAVNIFPVIFRCWLVTAHPQ